MIFVQISLTVFSLSTKCNAKSANEILVISKFNKLPHHVPVDWVIFFAINRPARACLPAFHRARGATLKVGGGGGGLNSDSKWGGWKHLFLSNSLKFPKKWGGWSPPSQPLPRREPCSNLIRYCACVLLKACSYQRRKNWKRVLGSVLHKTKKQSQNCFESTHMFLVATWTTETQLEV